MPHFRLYPRDSDGRLAPPEEIVTTSDEAAVKHAMIKNYDHEVEV